MRSGLPCPERVRKLNELALNREIEVDSIASYPTNRTLAALVDTKNSPHPLLRFCRSVFILQDPIGLIVQDHRQSSGGRILGAKFVSIKVRDCWLRLLYAQLAAKLAAPTTCYARAQLAMLAHLRRSCSYWDFQICWRRGTNFMVGCPC